MRKSLVLLSSILLLFIVSACVSTEEETSDVRDLTAELSEEFIEKLYTVDDANFDIESMSVEEMNNIQHEYEPYLTEDEFQELSARRLLSLPEEVASKLKNSISVENLELERYDRDEAEKASTDFEHSFTLVFKDEAGNQVEEIELNGQMTVIEAEAGLKISRYHDNKKLVEMMGPESN